MNLTGSVVSGFSGWTFWTRPLCTEPPLPSMTSGQLAGVVPGVVNVRSPDVANTVGKDPFSFATQWYVHPGVRPVRATER